MQMRLTRTRLHLAAMLLGAAVLASGCGFTMRGQDLGLPFKTIAIEGSEGVANEVRKTLQGQPSIKIVPKAVEAQVVLVISSQVVEKTIVAFSAAGRPREVQVRMRVIYKVTDGYAVEIAGLQEISQTRDLSVSESEILALGSAEAFIMDDMQKDIAQQLVRRLRAVKLPS